MAVVGQYYYSCIPWPCPLTYLDVLGVHVVGVQNDGAEVPHCIELEDHLHGLSVRSVSVVAPTHPLVACTGIDSRRWSR